MIDSAREAQPQQESEHTRDALEVKLDYNGRTWLHTNRFPWVDPQLIFGKETAEISAHCAASDMMALRMRRWSAPSTVCSDQRSYYRADRAPSAVRSNQIKHIIH